MSHLRETQEWMAGLLRRRQALPKDELLAEVARDHVTASSRLAPVEQLEIYREQFWLRHTAALLEDFPGLSGVLGQTDWERLVESYLGDVRPASWTLRDLGADLPAHVERATWLPHRELSADMAALEWAHVTAFDAGDVPELDATKLDSLTPEAWLTARIALHPSLVLLRFGYPVADLRRQLGVASGEPVVLPSPAARNVVVHRTADLSVGDAEVSDVALEVLIALRDGLSLVAACERAAARVPDGVQELEASAGRWFTEWARRGWVVDVQTQ